MHVESGVRMHWWDVCPIGRFCAWGQTPKTPGAKSRSGIGKWSGLSANAFLFSLAPSQIRSFFFLPRQARRVSPFHFVETYVIVNLSKSIKKKRKTQSFLCCEYPHRIWIPRPHYPKKVAKIGWPIYLYSIWAKKSAGRWPRLSPLQSTTPFLLR